ncbi:Hsp20/alpha crystallin family protein [Thermomicrobium sp. CFH 73360]|uniref:Hsp20/alpha crystallin family protein n=1 Tax=Thermomicrobium sp. CFH 73360 TaxID=2951987 RepID=UPI00207693B9|nr:Hsp20/alpha crystallin family protein [Thermomicrobium sp. CFH 73360]MCM8744909.1 Hsp20/alpha crystallin family protein [Thermomicrobium sp. CFH 73360]
MVSVRRSTRREGNRLQQEVVEAFQAWYVGFSPLLRMAARPWRPPLEVYEDERGLVVRAELAGLREDDISVVVSDSVLQISGVRRPREEGQRRTYHEMGIAYGPFEAEVLLPFPVDLDHVEAVYERGFLEVTLPRARVSRTVPLRSETSPES